MTNLEYIVKTLKDNPAIIARKIIGNCFACPKLKKCNNKLVSSNQKNSDSICNTLLTEWLSEKYEGGNN